MTWGKTWTVNVCGPERNFHNAAIYYCQGLFTLTILQMILKNIFANIFIYNRFIVTLQNYIHFLPACRHRVLA